MELEKEKKGGPIHVPAVSIQEFPTINGSTATLPLSYALYRLCTGAGEQEAEAAIYHGKTSSAWVSLMSNVRDPYDGGTELVIAYEPSEALIKELQNHVKKTTAPYKYPRVIEFVEELPKTISGKIRRVEIRQKSEK